MSHRLVVLLFMAMLALLGGCAPERPPALPEAAASGPARVNADWIRFRDAYPYHIQGIALSEPASDGSRTLIVAEPPPHITLADLKAVSQSLLASAVVAKHGIGHDGWTADVVVSLPRLDGAALGALKSSLQALLYGTTYKAYTLQIPSSPAAAPRSATLDLQVSAEELDRWLRDPDERYLPIDGWEKLSQRDLFRRGAEGVYLSEKPGLVVWSIPRGRPLEESAIEARQFALESDVVIGAAASPDAVLVIGRARVASLEVLPPVRVETLLLLASVDTNELAQSYERNSFFAGRFDGVHEWAPIYLSTELIDSEYGSLLDITDQLLKSWSNNGRTRYENFRYPDPGRWAFRLPLAKQLDAQSLVYNWNTAGLGTSFDLGSYELLSFRGTGALPVTYIAQQQASSQGGSSGRRGPGDLGPSVTQVPTEQAENDGYRFFASSNDPHLARVAQYAALYQIFRAFGVRAHQGSTFGGSAEAQAQVYGRAATSMLASLRDAGPSALEAAATRLIADADDVDPTRKQRLRFGARVLMGHMQHRLRELGDTRLAELAEKIAGATRSGEEVTAELTQVLAPELAGIPDLTKDILIEFADVKAIKDRYAAATKLRPGTWIHTPSVVVSWNEVPLQHSVGGHNLDAHVGHIRVSPLVSPGRPELRVEAGTRVVAVNEADFHEVSRAAAKGFRASSAEPPMPRVPELALKLPAAEALPADRGLRLGFVPVEGGAEGGWRFTSQKAAVEDTSLIAHDPEPSGVTLVVKRAESTLRVSGSNGVIDASTMPDAVDAIAQVVRRRSRGEGPAVVFAPGMTADEARGMQRSLDVRLSRGRESGGVVVIPGTPEQLLATSDVLGTRFDFSAVEIAEPEAAVVGGGQEELRCDVEGVLGGGREKVSLSIRLKAGLRELGVSIEKIRGVIAAVFKSHGGEPTGLSSLRPELYRELNKLSEHLGDEVVIKVHRQGKDLDIVLIEAGERARAQGQSG